MREADQGLELVALDVAGGAAMGSSQHRGFARGWGQRRQPDLHLGLQRSRPAGRGRRRAARRTHEDEYPPRLGCSRHRLRVIHHTPDLADRSKVWT